MQQTTGKRQIKQRLFALLLALTALCSAAACKRAEKQVEGSLTSLMDKVYANSGVSEWPTLASTPLTAENAAYYLGTDQVKFSEGLASEALISAIPHSVCLLRLAEGEDAAAAVKTIKENANPNKWICVGVEESDVVTDHIGNLVILIMADESAALHQGFLSLKNG